MKNYLFLTTALLTIATLTGCATVPENSLLNEARNDYTAAKNNTQVINLAPTELKQAGDALDKANSAADKKEDAAVVTHLAYLAKQRAAIAQETAKQKEAEIAVSGAATERSKIRLEARTEEAIKAQEEADKARQSAESSQRQAEAAQQQAREAEMRTSQLAAQLKELNAKKTERGLVITLGDVLFDTNKAQLKSGGTRSLQKLAGFLKQYPQRKAQIEGHTDSTGNADYNKELSDRRANAVRAYLVDMGISNERITTRGYGQESPVASNDTASGRQLNRRVEIILPEDNGNVTSP